MRFLDLGINDPVSETKTIWLFRDEKKPLKEYDTPECWSENKLRQKDTAALWVTHNGKNYFGYKKYIKPDSATKHITGDKATTANTHDSEVIDELLDKKEDGGQPVYADSAYRSETMEQMCREKKIKSTIQEKGVSGKPANQRSTTTY